MNILDIVVIIFSITVAVYGVSYGFVRQVMVTIGAYLGLLLATYFSLKLSFLVQGSNIRWLLLTLLLFTFVLLYIRLGHKIGTWIYKKIEIKNKLHRADMVAGGIVAAISCLIFLWLAITPLNRLSQPFVSRQINTSYIFYVFNNYLPAKPYFLTELASLLQPFSPPHLFIGGEPILASLPQATAKDLSEISIKSAASVVKIEGHGCGEISVGSGFIVNDSIVVTNAHVIAGNDKLYVQDRTGKKRLGLPIMFDPYDDIAVIHAKGTIGEPLSFSTAEKINYGSQAIIIGYPGGGELTASQALILRRIQALGYDIYDKKQITRDIFMISGKVVPGNSGGPLLDSEGKVIGIIIGHSYNQEGIAFALASQKQANIITKLSSVTQPVNTGACR